MDSTPPYILPLITSIASIPLSNIYSTVDKLVEKLVTGSRVESVLKSGHSYLVTAVAGVELILLVVVVFLSTTAYMVGSYTTLKLSLELLVVELSILSLLLFTTGGGVGGASLCILLSILVPTYSYTIQSVGSERYMLSTVIISSMLLLWRALEEVHSNPTISSVKVVSINIDLNSLQRYTAIYTSITLLAIGFPQRADAVSLLIPTLLTLPTWLALSLSYQGIRYIAGIRHGKTGVESILKYIQAIHRMTSNFKATLQTLTELAIRKILTHTVRVGREIEERMLRMVERHSAQTLYSIQKSFEKSLAVFSLILGIILLLAMATYIITAILG